MDRYLLKELLSRLSRHGFEMFVVELLSGGQEPFKPLPEAGGEVYYCELLDSYGGTIHDVYLLHFLPIEVFKKPYSLDTADPLLVGRVKRIKDIYEGEVGYWGMVDPELEEDDRLNSICFLSNLAHFDKVEYERKLFPRYQKLLRRYGLKPHAFGIGSCDSFVEKQREGTEKAFKRFINTYREGLSISIGEEQVQINRFITEKNLYSGVSRNSKYPYEPVLLDCEKSEVLEEFESLLRGNVREAELEKFLVAHFRDVFGTKYDRIETQLWLRFPKLDISSKERRLDVFLRNSVINDWELFEVKRLRKLTGTYRDSPVISREVVYAMQQVRNYARLLAQDQVRKRFAKEGIEYYQPSLHLVIGKKPQIPHEQWRWLITSNEKDVKLITFDELLTEMKERIKFRYGFA